MSATDRRGWRLMLHIAAIVALLTSTVTFVFTAVLADDPERIHAFGHTIIIHSGGEVVIRTPAGQIQPIEAFTSIDPYRIWWACTLYLAAWFLWMVARLVRQVAQPANVRRGFPMD